VTNQLQLVVVVVVLVVVISHSELGTHFFNKHKRQLIVSGSKPTQQLNFEFITTFWPLETIQTLGNLVNETNLVHNILSVFRQL